MSKESRSGNGGVGRKQFVIHIDVALIRQVKILRAAATLQRLG